MKNDILIYNFDYRTISVEELIDILENYLNKRAIVSIEPSESDPEDLVDLVVTYNE